MDDSSDCSSVFSQRIRLDPIGAPNDSEGTYPCDISSPLHIVRYQYKDEDHELLHASVFALTNHLAQIQFRLRQIVNASPQEKENLLESLEDFASRELPSISNIKDDLVDSSVRGNVEFRYYKQQELVDDLKICLYELKLYCSDVKVKCDPSDNFSVFERMQIVISELGRRCNLKIDESNCLLMKPASLRQKVNEALDEMLEPLEEKDALIRSYREKVEDLEKYITYLQENIKKFGDYCTCLVKLDNNESSKRAGNQVSTESSFTEKLLALFRMFLKVYIGCGLYKPGDRTRDKNHWGNLRAKLQLAILRVRKIIQKAEEGGNEANYPAVTSTVLNYLAPAIRDLMQHGLIYSENHPVVPLILCVPRISIDTHAWKILLNYYVMMKGDQVCLSPARRLSQSFNLDIGGASPQNDEEHLLMTIDRIISLYRTYKRNSDVHFKAFICAALNAKKLVTWLSIIFQCDALIKFHYLPWSYVARTRFQDSLVSLDVLTNTKFDLPVDYAIRKFLNIEDMFT